MCYERILDEVSDDTQDLLFRHRPHLVDTNGRGDFGRIWVDFDEDSAGYDDGAVSTERYYSLCSCEFCIDHCRKSHLNDEVD